jgi:gliding motility-associated-like protein
MSRSFVHSSNCPPVLVSFSNTSLGGIRYEWDFGDGVSSTGFSPSHLYTRPGKYQISLRVFGFNGLEGTYTDSVEITLPQATFVANPLTGCTSQQVSFLGRPSRVASYYWDFGDGTITFSNDSLASHQYLTPGRYLPRLLVTDSNGCTLPVAFADTVTIDSLFLALPGLQRSLCDTATQLIQPEVRAVTGNTNIDNYTYNWVITYNGQSTTVPGRTLRYAFGRAGLYRLQLRVQTPTGCDKTLTDSVTVLQGTRAIITGPTNGCVQAPLTFTGSTSTPLPGISWRWLIGTQSFTRQNPPPVVFDAAGTLSVQLIATSGQCADTAQQQLTIHARLVLQIADRNPVLCLGSGINLQVSGAATWQWQPAAGLSSATIPNPVANPAENTLYRVTGTSAQGCTTTDSVNVRVAKPFAIALTPATAEICAGQQVPLQATGAAATWLWVGNTAGLSNTNTANPTARPATTTTYTVVATDADRCFTDTATLTVEVNPLPTVNAGPDIELVSGTAANLTLTTTGNIVRYSWTPARDLSCTTCPNPVANPTIPVQYVVSVATDKNCTATDSLNIIISCGKTYYIPTGFTPNGDGLNDYFYVLGGGGNVRQLQVYNRWGDLVFERKNVPVNDRSSGWEGRIKGNQAPAATYIYTAVVECIDGTVYEYKGSVMLMR